MYGIFTYIYHKNQPNVGEIYHTWILWVNDLFFLRNAITGHDFTPKKFPKYLEKSLATFMQPLKKMGSWWVGLPGYVTSTCFGGIWGITKVLTSLSVQRRSSHDFFFATSLFELRPSGRCDAKNATQKQLSYTVFLLGKKNTLVNGASDASWRSA